VWVEYGLQTTNNALLEGINRHHTFEDFLDALVLTKKHGLEAGVHMIIGLSGFDRGQVEADAKALSRLDIDGIKFHVLHVVKDTPLEAVYRDEKITLLTQDEYITLFCDFLELIPRQVIILRAVSTAQRDYLIAPRWINQRSAVLEGIEREFARRKSYQGYRYEGVTCKS